MATRFLLDDAFVPPAPGGVDPLVSFTTLRAHDPALVDPSVPDWYTYLRAAEDGFDALVVRDWHQVEQAEELWCLSRSPLSIVTWRHATDDPLQSWDRLVAHLPEVMAILAGSGPSVIVLPSSPRGRAQPSRATDLLGQLARDLGRMGQEVRGMARRTVTTELAALGERGRFAPYLG